MLWAKKHGNRDSKLGIEFAWPYTFQFVCQWSMYKLVVNKVQNLANALDFILNIDFLIQLIQKMIYSHIYRD